ncbi:Alpha/Beta hydrolase protein [Xylariomycetidae sp. FL2044]|nr:Alpha/Beta hydrolase protein [Xylariomycetidae sp. FL2044]
MTRSFQLTTALLALATLSSPTPLPASTRISKQHARAYLNDSISWAACPEDSQLPSNLQCASYTVPLDWDASRSNETIELGMVRLEASDKSNRIGYLFINPGGPGGQASSTLAAIAQQPEAVDAELLERFDWIALDPRGAGLSTPLQCDIDTYNQRVSLFPTTQDEFDALVEYNKAVGNSCRAKSGRLVDFIDTISAVKDHEAVRVALGGEKPTFLGLSYGSQLFSQYAQLYPDNFRAMILDGNLQHSQAESSNILIESSAYQAALRQFFEWCTGSEDCPLQGQDVEAVFTSVFEKAKEAPIPAPGCDDVSCRSDVTWEEMLFNIQGLINGVSSWPDLAEALVDADNGNATTISSLQPLAVGDAYTDSYLFAGTAIACQDWAHEATILADVQQKAILGEALVPLLKGASQSWKIQTTCIGWPAALTNPPRPVRYDGETPILMVNSVYDSSTGYSWALGLQKEVKNAVLLTRQGAGHTSYLLGGETTQIENAYLVNMTLPEPGTITES